MYSFDFLRLLLLILSLMLAFVNMIPCLDQDSGSDIAHEETFLGVSFERRDLGYALKLRSNSQTRLLPDTRTFSIARSVNIPKPVSGSRMCRVHPKEEHVEEFRCRKLLRHFVQVPVVSNHTRFLPP